MTTGDLRSGDQSEIAEETRVLYERLCRVSSKLPLFARLASRRKDKDLSRAVRFLAPRMKLTDKGVVSAAYFLPVVLGFTMVWFMSFIRIGFLAAVSLSAIAAIVVYYLVISYPVSLMNSYRIGLSEEADVVFEQFLLVFQSGGTLFDAIEMVAQSDHPYLSKAFQNVLQKISDGVPPETCIAELARDQPSEDLRRYLLAVISSLERKTDLLELLSGESFEADLALRQKNLELESRLLIVSALTTYIPMMFVLAASLAGYVTNPLIVLAAPMFIGLSVLLRSRFSIQFSAYFDRPRKSGPLAPSQKEIVAEYDEFLDFLMLLGERLRTGDTLERALPAVRDQVGPEVQRLIDPAIGSVYWRSLSTKEAMSIAAGLALGQRVSRMMGIISLMCETSALQAGERLTQIAARLIKRSAVAKERDSILAAQKLKVYLLNFTSSVVLGLLTSLSPFLFIGGLLSGGPGWGMDGHTLLEMLPLVLTLVMTTVSTGFQNTKMVGGGHPWLAGLVCCMLYAAAFALSSVVLGLA